MNEYKFELNLVILLKLFNERPNHLAKYLIKNNALTEEFKFLVLNSDKLDNIKPINEQLDFSDFNEMYSYFDKLIENNDLSDKLNLDPLSPIELNDRLSKLLEEEMFEDAAKLRDYMEKNNIKIII